MKSVESNVPLHKTKFAVEKETAEYINKRVTDINTKMNLENWLFYLENLSLFYMSICEEIYDYWKS